jgi:hypothetical protein
VKSLFVNRKNNASLGEKAFGESGSVKLGERVPTPDLERMRFMCLRSEIKHGVYNDDSEYGPPLILPKLRQVNIPKRVIPSVSTPFGIYNSESQDLGRRARAPAWTFRKIKPFRKFQNHPRDLVNNRSQFTINQSGNPDDRSQIYNASTSTLIVKSHLDQKNDKTIKHGRKTSENNSSMFKLHNKIRKTNMDMFMVGGESGGLPNFGGNLGAPYAIVKKKNGGMGGKTKGGLGKLDLTLSNQNKKNAEKYYLTMKKNATMLNQGDPGIDCVQLSREGNQIYNSLKERLSKLSQYINSDAGLKHTYMPGLPKGHPVLE